MSGDESLTSVQDKPVDSDALLVERAVAGDHKAFEMLVIKYQRRIQRLIGRMVRDVDLVEDIAQETFIRAYRALAQFRGEAKFYTWLYRIAVNTAKKSLMDLKRNPTVSENASKSVRKRPKQYWPARKLRKSSMPPWRHCQRSFAKQSPCEK